MNKYLKKDFERTKLLIKEEIIVFFAIVCMNKKY